MRVATGLSSSVPLILDLAGRYRNIKTGFRATKHESGFDSEVPFHACGVLSNAEFEMQRMEPQWSACSVVG